jgi:hypothetical protein
MSNDDPRRRLRELRDKLAFEAPRAKARPSSPPEMAERLQSTLDWINELLAAPPPATPAAGEAVAEAREEALVEAHLALHEWQRWLERDTQPKSKAFASADRRQHERHQVDIEVRLVRRRRQSDSREVALTDVPPQRARNVSLSGILVMLATGVLPDLAVNDVLTTAVLVGTATFEIRGGVVRRDANGLALRWLVDERAQRTIDALLDAIRNVRRER